MPRSIRNALYWLLPSLICAWIHRDGLHAWFQADDFAFLGLNTEYYNWPTFWHALFRATPQGGFRPWTEHLFFFAFWHWFGWNALPYRVFILLTQSANLVMLTILVRKLSGSKAAGFLAPIVWVTNSALVPAMAWTCAYEEVLCPTFLLAALLIFSHSRENRVWYFLQLAIFILGFGVLEVNLIYPALAASYACLYNRRLLPWTAPMFVLSAVYFVLHTVFIPVSADGAYHPHYDASVLFTFVNYWQMIWVPQYGTLTAQPLLTSALLITGTLGIVLFLISEARQHRYAAAFFACWFVIALGPLLPFRDHLTQYYLTIPLIGIACIAALALARWRVWATPVFALYLAVQLPTLAQGQRWYLDRSRASRALVLGVKQIHDAQPAKQILLTDVTSDLYSFTIPDVPFRLIPNVRVYLAPDALDKISGLPANIASVSNFVLPAGPTRHSLLAGDMVVYSAAENHLQEVTAAYTARQLALPEPGLPHHVDVGLPALAYLLGPEWYPLEGPYRWMANRATLRMTGPTNAEQKLLVSGFAIPESLKLQPLELSISIDGAKASVARIGPQESHFTKEFALPAQSIGKPVITVELSVNHTLSAQQKGRELGLVFGTFEIVVPARGL